MTGEQQVSGSNTCTVGYGYDANAHLSTLVYPEDLTSAGNRIVAYAPNALGQPTQAGSYATNVTYYPNGAIAGFTYGNGIVHTLTQNARGLPDRSRDANGSTSIHDDSYVYDAVGNVAAIADGVSGARGDRDMTYDALNRLTLVTGAGGAPSPMFGTASYAYDVLDNLTHVQITGGSHPRNQTYVYIDHNRLTNVMEDGSSVLGLGYDAQGNLTNRNGVLQFGFDYGNRMRTGGPESYRYDAQGRRIRSSSSAGAIYSLYAQSGQLLFQRDERSGKRRQYVYLGGSLVAESDMPLTGSTATVTYQHTDALGSPVATTDSAKTVLQRSEYEPYGYLLNRPMEDGPGYTGHVTDEATGLVYMQQRYYDPLCGCFVSTDPVPALRGSFNRYWYANANPYKYTDPDGRDCVSTNGVTTCSTANYVVSFPAQKGFQDFTTQSQNYHAYSVPVSTPGNTLAQNQAYVKRYPTPGVPSPATPQGTFNDATPVFGGISPIAISPVMSFSLTNQLNGQPVVVNVTLPGHQLASGIVVRQASQDANGNTSIQNWGEGTSELQAPGSPVADEINSVWEGQKPGTGTPSPTGCASGRDSVCNN